MDTIVIGVACHKVSQLPQNSLYLPIHVGAALTDRRIPGCQRDDEGDGISEKNPQYCELTAQYWLWKNVDADYYGLCHYRRFINFTDEEYAYTNPDNRGQVAARVLNPFTMRKYGIEDEAAMRRIIGAHDAVCTKPMDLRKVQTPYGTQPTVYSHFEAHDRTLVMKPDLDTMIRIVDECYPAYATDLHEVLDGHDFLGYNCFVMRRELFFELCEFEFGVLEKLEAQVDLSDYNQALTRIYGYMGEILYTAFMHGLAKRGCDIEYRQMLFFEGTDPAPALVPASADEAGGRDVAPLAFVMQPNEKPYYLEVALASLREHMAEGTFYDIIVVHGGLDAWWRGHIAAEFAELPNAQVRFIDGTGAVDEVWERIGVAGEVHALLPSLLPAHDRVVSFDTDVVFAADPAPLLAVDLGGCPLGATRDEAVIGQFNGIYPDAFKRLTGTIGVQKPFDLFSTSVLVWDLAAARTMYPIDELIGVWGLLPSKATGSERLNLMYADAVQLIDQAWCVFSPIDEADAKALSQVPARLMAAHKAAAADARILRYDRESIWMGIGADIVVEFWRLARQADTYEMFLTYSYEATRKDRFRRSLDEFGDKLFPLGSARRDALVSFVRGNYVTSRGVRQILKRNE